MRKATWRTKLLASFVVVLGIVFSFELLYVLPKLRDREVELVVATQEDIAQSIARELDVDLLRIRDRLIRMAGQSEFQEMDTPLQSATMAQHIEISSLVASLFVIDSEGSVVSRTDTALSPAIGAHLVEDRCFTVPFSEGEPYFSEPHYDADRGIVFVQVSVPVELKTGERVGVLTGSMVLNELIKRVQHYPLFEGTTASVKTQQGVVPACSGIDLFALQDGPLSYVDEHHALARAIIAGDVKELGQHNHGDTPYVGSFSILESNGWAVIVGSTAKSIQAATYSTFWTLVVSNIVIFIGAIAAVFLLSRAIMARQERTEARFRSFYEDSPLGYQSLDSEGRLVDVNHKWLEATGYEKDEVIGHALSEFLSPASAVHHREAFERMKSTDAPHGAELELQRKDGSHFLALFSGTVAYDDKGNFKQTHCVFTDITERVQAKKMLEQERDRAQTYLNVAAVAMIALDKEGRITRVNRHGAEMIGYSEEQLLGKDWFKTCIPVRLRLDVRDVFGQLMAGEVDPLEYYENLILTKDGEERTVAWRNALLRDDEGTIIGTLSSGQDVTERKHTNQALAESEDRYRSLFENMINGFALHEIVLNQAGKPVDYVFLEANSAFERLTTLKCGDIIGKKATEVLPGIEYDPANWIGKYGEVSLGGSDIRFEQHSEVLGKWFSVLAFSPRQGQFATIFEDVTERKRAEEEKLSTAAHLRQSQKLESIGTLASGVAHEINNPLMGMINYADLLSGKVADDTLKEYSQVIMQEGNRIATIVRDLLAFSRQDKETHSPARIKDIINSSVSLVGSTLRKDQISIELDIPRDLPQLKCRSQQIQQVIINLLTNAHDALNARYPEYDDNKLIRITVRLFEKEGEDWIRTTIEDHGIGISDDVLERIFDPFFTTKSRDQGTGLGLSVSFGIVREHHGELTVESVPGEYTRFRIELRVSNGWSHKKSQEEDA